MKARPMPSLRLTAITFFFITTRAVNAQELSLQDCFHMADQRNVLIHQSQAALARRKFNLEAEKQNYWPKVDALASYTYLSRPLEINLQAVRNGIVTGSSTQAVNTANEVYQQITGNALPQAVQTQIYNTSKTIIDAAYPDYNPELSQQSYFLAGLAVRQPLFLGNKLTAARELAESEMTSGVINTEVTEKAVSYAIALQYIRICYINALLKTQQAVIDALVKNQGYGQEMVKNQILPPYQVAWTRVLVSQAKTLYNNVVTDKQNATVELNKLMGTPLDTSLTILKELSYKGPNVANEDSNFWEANPDYQLVASKVSAARTSEKLATSLSLPNLFAVGNLNLYQGELPVTIAPWMIGVEMQWTLFNGTQTIKRRKAAKELVQEVKLAGENTKESLEVQLIVAKNKLLQVQGELDVIDSTRRDIATTRRMVNERFQNQLSSLKDLNDVILLQAEVEKSYETALLEYYVALATYWNIKGTPQRIAELIQ
jgi:outer membrane protein TolC